MIEAPLALAFAAGLVATVNPCGFAMLPAYLSSFMGLRDETPGSGVGTALRVGGLVSSGFLVVFLLAGIGVSAGARVLITVVPWLALGVGALLLVLGIAMIRGFTPTVGLPKAKRATRRRGYGGVFLFGVSYAVASLSCTLPVFLTVVAAQAARGTFLSSVVTFLAYGAGMSLALVGLTMALALGKATLVARFRRAVRHVNRISGVILVAAGAYIVGFWTTSLRSGAGALGGSGAFRFVEGLSQWALQAIGGRPLAWTIGLATVVVAGGALLLVTERRREAAEAPEADRGRSR